MKIKTAYECPANEGTAIFRVGSSSYRFPWVVGSIITEERDIGSSDTEYGTNYRREEFVVVCDEDGAERVIWPIRYALLEYESDAEKQND